MMDNMVSSLSNPTFLADPQIDSETTDAYLLGEFVTAQDEAAFAALVTRHGGLVRGVCRRIVMDPATADDAFQHTFLSLAQHAEMLLRSVAPTASLGSWLYRVAVNASLQLKRKARSRRRTESQFAEERPNADSPSEPWNEVLPALDEEISALPGQHRSAVVKCHLEGKTQQDAAKELGITYATLRRRLKEARGMLRSRLTERGFAKNGFLLAPLLGCLAVTEPVSAQMAAAVTSSVIAGSTAPVVTAATASLSLGGKLLALSPVIKTAIVGLMMIGAVGSWWGFRAATNSRSVHQFPLVETSVVSHLDDESTSINKPASHLPKKSNPLMNPHFGYVFQNGHPISPELENALKVLEDSESKPITPEHADFLKLPTLVSSHQMLQTAHLGSPLPKNTDLLSEVNPVGLSDHVTKIGLVPDPNAVLLMANSKQEREPLGVEQAMQILNEQQQRRSQNQFGSSSLPTSQFLGHPNTKSGKTLRVLPLP